MNFRPTTPREKVIRCVTLQMKTTCEINELHDCITNGQDKWFSVSDVEQLQKELKDNMCVCCGGDFGCEINQTRAKQIDEVFNNFKGK